MSLSKSERDSGVFPEFKVNADSLSFYKYRMVVNGKIILDHLSIQEVSRLKVFLRKIRRYWAY